MHHNKGLSMAAGRGMFVFRDDGELVEMLERQYDSESLLQALLARYPNQPAYAQMVRRCLSKDCLSREKWLW